MAGVEFVRLAVVGFGVFERRQELVLRDRQLTLIVGDNQDTRAALSNGTGKTTVFKAVSWCLYQRTIDGLTTDVIHRRARSAEVQLELRVDEQPYRVTRRRTRTSARLDLHRFEPDPDGPEHVDGAPGRWVDHGQSKAAHTQEAIEALLGMGWDAFRSCVLFGQGDHARFASPHLGDAARKGVLSTVLDLERYSQARERARALRQRADAALARWQTASSAAERQRATLQTRRAFLDGQRATTLAASHAGEESVADLEADLGALDAERLDLLELLATSTAALDDATARLQATAEVVERAQLDQQRANLERAEVEHRLASLATDGPCPTCGQHRRADPSRLAALRADLERMQAALIALNHATTDARQQRDDARKDQTRLREDAQTLRDRHAHLRARREAQSERRDRLRQTLTTAAATLAALDAQLAEADAALSDLDRAAASASDRITRLTALQRQVDLWLKGFGPKGVPALAMEQCLPVLNARANRHLFDLGDGDLAVRWTATGERTDGGEKEELTQHITVEGLDDVAPSGGQMRKIELATELALAEIAAESSHRGTNVVFFDEVLDGLDAEGTRRVCEWLEGLPFASIFLVSHNSGVADAFDHVITVTKRGGAADLDG